MREIIELARNLTFFEASSHCKANSRLSLRRTDNGNGFSVWGEEPTDRIEKPQENSTMCYKCSGSGRAKLGDICTLCNGTGRLKYEPPAIPHSLDGPTFPEAPSRPSTGLSQLQIRRILLEQERSSTPVASPKNKWESCHQCGGDGGAAGRCPRCGGNGFEPEQQDPPF